MKAVIRLLKHNEHCGRRAGAFSGYRPQINLGSQGWHTCSIKSNKFIELDELTEVDIEILSNFKVVYTEEHFTLHEGSRAVGIGYFKKEKPDVEKDFDDAVDRLSYDQFWAYTKSWLDVDFIRNVMKGWDEKTKLEATKEIWKRYLS